MVGSLLPFWEGLSSGGYAIFRDVIQVPANHGWQVDFAVDTLINIPLLATTMHLEAPTRDISMCLGSRTREGYVVARVQIASLIFGFPMAYASLHSWPVGPKACFPRYAVYNRLRHRTCFLHMF